MRIAWFGGVHGTSGVGSIAVMLMQAVLHSGVQIDCYGIDEGEPEWAKQYPNLKFVSTPTRWQWGKWYSNSSFKAFLSGTISRTRAYQRLCDLLIDRHAEHPYDCIVQISQTELFKLGQNRHRLPPIVIYPCVHAAGELRWHRLESAYALQSENFWMHYITRVMLTYRAWVQKRELRKPSLIIGMSQRFNDLVAHDYGVEPERQAVLYQSARPQPLAEVQASDAAAASRSVTKLLFVARISVRKGLQYIIELSKRLDDLAGQVEIEVIGDKTQWSDYREHLKDLNPKVATYRGGMNYHDVSKAYNSADILLLPSLYEPGGIVVGEALSQGLCVVVSDAIGSAEVVEGECRREFPAGDMDQFEQQVRELIADLKLHRQELRQQAREQAARHFAPEKISADFIKLLEQIVPNQGKIAPASLDPKPNSLAAQPEQVSPI
ncbi:MAG: glycosyltransferase family 4 protein [Myxacorys californica WJT36-NPBG1]|jgi:glycosyltransferase involved in cell wall biosynthesis|nr:glycosyltransferase family 4 protein [Myxacorys californica WJT36-NPBG1]